jgi:hypothetical protein
MNNLITEVRRLIDDTTAPYDYTDEQITRYLDKRRGYIEEKGLTAVDDSELIYYLGYKNIARLVIQDTDDNVISAATYDLDYLNGIVTFTTDPGSIEATFTYHDINDAVAELWLARAAQARFSGRIKLADEELPADKNSREYCIGQYWYFKRSRNVEIERG